MRNSSPPYTALCVATRIIGGRSFISGLELAISEIPYLDCKFLYLDSEDYAAFSSPWWARVASPIEAQYVARKKYEAQFSNDTFDCVLLTGWEFLHPFRDLVRTCTSVLFHDLTPRLAATLSQGARPGVAGLIKTVTAGQLYHQMFSAVVPAVDHFFPRTPWCAESLRKDYGIPASECSVTWLPVDTEVWKPAVRTPGERPVILFVGNSFEAKGGPILLEAYSKYLSHLCDLRIVSTDKRVQSMPAIAGVEIIPGLTREDLIPVYQSSDLFVLPTRREAAGNVFAEACAVGLPCIGTDVGGVHTLVRDGVNGHLLPIHAGPYEWAAAIRALLEDADYRYKLGLNSRKIAVENLSLTHFKNVVKAGIERVLGQARTSGSGRVAVERED